MSFPELKKWMYLMIPYMASHQVRFLQLQLSNNGIKIIVDGIFGPQTEASVVEYQKSRGLHDDGVVGPATWGQLKSDHLDPQSTHDKTNEKIEKVIAFADNECQDGAYWTGPDCDVDKYLEHMRPALVAAGHLPAGNKSRFSWCASFVHYCFEHSGSGIEIPKDMSLYWATMALVESWKRWATEMGYWIPRGDEIEPIRGDVIVWDWPQTGPQSDHIGFVSSFDHGILITSEGNRNNRRLRAKRHYGAYDGIEGFIRIA